jgi:hypothetical protein
MQSKPYNDIYERLVDNDDDITGIVSYAFYKKQKVEWAKRIREQNSGAVPTQEQHDAFYTVASTETAIDGYRKQAQISMDKFLESIVQEFGAKVEEIESDVESKLEDLERQYDVLLKRELKEARGEPWRISIAKNLVASFLFVLLVGVIYFFTFALEVNIIGGTKAWIEKHVSATSDVNASEKIQK